MSDTPREGRLAALYLAPAGLILLAFGVGPMLYAAWLSLHSVQGRETTWIAAHNYTEALTGEEFRSSLAITFYYALGTVPLTIILGFLLAWALYRVAVFQHFFRTVFFLPYITSVVAAAMIWRTFFEPRTGLANTLLEAIGLPAQQWLLEPRGLLYILSGGAIPPEVGPSLALCSVMLFEIWRSLGFVIVLFLAALANVPRELQEAGRLDGASSTRVITAIVLPLVSPTLFFVAVVSLIGAFQAFGNLYALTGDGDGPLNTTQNLTVYIYSTFIDRGRIGYGSAVSVLLCAAIALLTALQWRVAGRKVFYQ